MSEVPLQYDAAMPPCPAKNVTPAPLPAYYLTKTLQNVGADPHTPPDPSGPALKPPCPAKSLTAGQKSRSDSGSEISDLAPRFLILAPRFRVSWTPATQTSATQPPAPATWRCRACRRGPCCASPPWAAPPAPRRFRISEVPLYIRTDPTPVARDRFT